ALLASAYACWFVLRALLWAGPFARWPSLLVVILLLGGVQLVALGLIGEYLGRLYMEAKQRPLYLVPDWIPGPARPAAIPVASGVCSGQSTAAGGGQAPRAASAGSEGA